MSFQFATLSCLSLAVLTLFNEPAAAQAIAVPGTDAVAQNSYPNSQYYVALQIYRDGNLGDAAEAFDSALGRCRRDINGRWIDAIPVHAMLGECFYQAGDLPAAVEQFDTALALMVQHHGWLSSLDWRDMVLSANRTADSVSSWAGANVPPLLPVSDRMKLSTGSLDVEGQIRRGGAFEAARLTAIDAIEILRGVAIAAYRRRVIFGPLAGQTEVIEQALEATKYPAGLDLAAPRAVIGAMRGCERFAGGQDSELASDASKSTMVSGSIHPLTPLVLLSSARAIALTDKFAEAIPVAMQAAVAASALGQPEWVGEAFLIAAGCVNETSANPLLGAATAAAAAHLRRGRLASVGSLLAASEAAMLAGDLASAQTALSQVGSMLQRRDIVQPRMAAHAEYLSARAAAHSGQSFGLSEPTAIDNALARMTNFASGNGPKLGRVGNNNRRPSGAPATPRLYQLGLVTEGARSRGLGGKVVDEKINQYAGDPPAAVWRADPVDALSYQMFDRTPSITAQLISAVKRNAQDDLVPLADALLRQRFLAGQSAGGRVLQVRRMVATDKALLTEQVAAAMLKPPRAMTEMINLHAPQAPPAGSAEWLQRGQRLESLAALVALQRGEIPAASPPEIANLGELKKLPKGTGLLVFVDVGGTVVAILYANDTVRMWNVAPTKSIAADISKLLRELGVPSSRSTERLKAMDTWKKEAATLRRKVIIDTHLKDVESLESLVVVPDGALWYLPMEILPLGDENAELLGDRMSIRYASTPGLAVHATALPNDQLPVGIVSQMFFAPRDGEANSQSIKQITEALKATTMLPANPLVPASLLGDQISSLAVFGVVAPNPAQPMSFAPANYDAADAAGSLASWLRFPSSVPRSVFLPGYRTAASSPALGDGRELFMALTALQCSGVRDVVISRWPVGGESTAILMREFLQELPFEGAAAAWRRAIQTLRHAPLQPESEPLLGGKDENRDELSGEHPLFWAGYLITSPPQKAIK